MSLVALIPAAAQRLTARPAATPRPTPMRTAPPAAVLKVDPVPGNLGGPIGGPGARVMGVVIRTGIALPITQAAADIAQWRGQPGILLPLAPMPSNLVLRGTDSTSTPAAGLSIQSVSPSRASTAHDTVVTIQGSGFVAGPVLRVRFNPVASQVGAFDGLAATLVNASTLPVKVPARHQVAAYTIQR